MGKLATINQSKKEGKLITAGNNDHIRKMEGKWGQMGMQHGGSMGAE